MNVFLLDTPESEADVDYLIESRPRSLRMPDGRRLLFWFPRVVWQAEDFAVVSGFKEGELMAWAVEESERTGFPVEITYPFIVYCAAHKAAEILSRSDADVGPT
jgi:hypothetical protein